jgi:hypothetical protein
MSYIMYILKPHHSLDYNFTDAMRRSIIGFNREKEEHTKKVANLQATATTYLVHAVLGPQVANWLQQYHELAATTGLNEGALSLE